jgi:hypothetical protein
MRNMRPYRKVIFNALPGSITKDFHALQYFSCPNQVIATSTRTITYSCAV